MRKFILSVFLFLSAWGLQAQEYKLVADASIPAEAAQVLVQRFTQVLSAGGLSVKEDAAQTIRLVPTVTSRMEVSDSNVALTIDLTATVGEVSEVFPIKGVGENEADAWLRAAKLILPRSKAATSFVEKLKKQ